MSDGPSPLDPEATLELLRSHSWHPETVGACLRQVRDWLSDTGQHAAASELWGIWVTAPDDTPMTAAELIGTESSEAKRQQRVRDKAEIEAKLEPWGPPELCGPTGIPMCIR
ncbi:hypothetical protein [Candidatus Poriferisodalis sp.]|uniref:hypothetical protein n=1 Tax=Candidatus Poriferisodalis sp. TaxID=3101277 RepID=UPI003B02344C